MQYLSATGVGTIGILDDDVVDISNLHRQVIHQTGAVGTYKCDSAKSFIKNINPHVNVITHPIRLSNDNAFGVISQYDLVLDCTDHPAVRYLINDVCVLLGKTIVSGSGLKADGQFTILNFENRAHVIDVLPPAAHPKLSHVLCRWWGYRSSNRDGGGCNGNGNHKNSHWILHQGEFQPFSFHPILPTLINKSGALK